MRRLKGKKYMKLLLFGIRQTIIDVHKSVQYNITEQTSNAWNKIYKGTRKIACMQLHYDTVR